MTIKKNQKFIFSPLYPRLFSIFYIIRFYSSSITPQDFVPERYYSNADILKEKILKENKDKSGVYRWTNKINNKSYIGSAKDLRKRFYSYFSAKHLERSSMYINRALLKNGYSNFSLEILIYCEPAELLKKENEFFKLLKPYYNILPTAGSPLGTIRSEETKQKISESIKGSKHPNYGKKISLDTKQRISEARKGQIFGSAIGIPVEVLDLETNEIKIYASGRLAAKDLGIYPTTVFRAIKNSKPVKKRWIIKFIE